MFVWFSLPASLSAVIAEISLSSTEAGLLIGSVPLMYIPLALISGLIVDRLGPRRSIGFGVIIYGFAQVGRSLAPGFLSLFVCSLLLGVGATLITFGLPKLVSILFPPDQTGLPSGMYLVGAAAGTAGAFSIGQPILVPFLDGWRQLFFWSGIIALCYSGVWFALARWYSLDQYSVASGPSSFTRESVIDDLRVILTHRELQLVVVIGTVYLSVNHGIQGWLPTILEARGYTPARGGQITSLFVGAYTVGVLSIPALADRFRARHLAVVGCGAGVFIGILGITFGLTPLLTVFGILVAGGAVGGLSPLIRAIPTALEEIGSRLTGTAVGFVFSVGEIGGFIGPVLIGSLHDSTGSFVPGLSILAGTGIVVCLAGVGLRTRTSQNS